jgi:hypothetical protein
MIRVGSDGMEMTAQFGSNHFMKNVKEDSGWEALLRVL